jgi:tetratricopeptide (TPR) repeat protein
MRTKEVMVTAPLLLLLYDVLFLSPSFAQLLRRRWGFYTGLVVAAVWLTLPLIRDALPKNAAKESPVAAGERNRPRGPERFVPEESAGFGLTSVTPLDYARSQPEVIVHYLRLTVWPDALCLDCAWPITPSWGAAAPYAVGIGLLVLATLWALVRRSWLGFLGAWFFLILAPTSSIMPLSDLAFDHRMYLPLAAVVVLGVIGGYVLVDTLARHPSSEANPWYRLGIGLVGVLVVGLGFATILRNADFRTAETIWRDVVAKRPANARGWGSLADALRQPENQGKRTREVLDEAIADYEKALSIPADSELAHNPPHVYPIFYNNLGAALMDRGEIAKAIACYAEAIRLMPIYGKAYNNLGVAQYKLAYSQEGKKAFQRSLRQAMRSLLAPWQAPRLAPSPFQRKLDKAVQSLRRATELEGKPQFHFNLATVLFEQGNESVARQEYQQALRQDPTRPEQVRQFAWRLANGTRLPGDGLEAVFLAKQACQAYEAIGEETDIRWKRLAAAYVGNSLRAAPGKNPTITWAMLAAVYWHTRAAAHAADQDYDQAICAAEKALRLASGTPALHKQIETDLRLYESERPRVKR